MLASAIVLGVCLLAAAWAVWTYNRLILLGNLLGEAWSGIDVQLKRRHDLIPNLVETVKGYASHERGLLEEIARLRSQTQAADSIARRGQTESALTASLKTLFAVAEGYPELKADQNFLRLQQDLSAVEEYIQLARRYYNGTVRNRNILIESFPSFLIAAALRAQKSEYFVLGADEKAAPTVSF
jgi:LemA protein